MTRWEYMVHTLSAAGVFTTGHVDPRQMQDVLNHYGQQGWELVTAFDTSGTSGGSRFVILTFKRPAPIPVPPPFPGR